MTFLKILTLRFDIFRISETVPTRATRGLQTTRCLQGKIYMVLYQTPSKIMHVPTYIYSIPIYLILKIINGLMITYFIVKLKKASQ